MNFDEIRKYWDDRAAGDASPQSTTQDVYLREIEFQTLSQRIGTIAPATIADVGCGDGRTTARLANCHPGIQFVGFDYSPAMISNALRIHGRSGGPQVRFLIGDVCDGLSEKFDLIYTTRCLINLPSWGEQKIAITNIHGALNKGGSFLMIENFLESHLLFNQVREEFGLDPIPIREHNHFFERPQLIDFMEVHFFVDYEVNISSTYYLATRVIYAKLCAERGVTPDYFDSHHRLAVGLPFAGEFGPVRIIHFRKR